MGTILEQLAALEQRLVVLEGKVNGKDCPFKCIVREHVDMLHNENEALSMIFGDAYVDKLRDIENIVMELLNVFFRGDKTYEQLKKDTSVFEGKSG